MTSRGVTSFGTTAESAYRDQVLARIRRLSSTELASCILAVDSAACRDNLEYAARRIEPRRERD